VKKRHSESRTLTYGLVWICVHNFHIYCPIWIKFNMRNPQQYSNSVEYFRVLGKSVLWRPYFSYLFKRNYSHARTMKSHDVFIVKNALVNSVPTSRNTPFATFLICNSCNPRRTKVSFWRKLGVFVLSQQDSNIINVCTMC